MLSASRTAVLFPGQGSQTPGMRDDVRPDLLDAVIELVGDDPFARVDESTAFAQPAIFCASLSNWTRLADRVDPVALAGHSLGEITALTAAGALDELDALKLVVLRGRLMAEAGAASGGGTMLAVLRGTPARASALAARHGVTVANDNAPDQVVLSGARAALEGAGNDARAQGLRAMMLDVAGAFHSPQMADAVAPFSAALAATEFRAPRVKVVSCATAAAFTDPRVELAKALTSPVRWRETMAALAADDIATFVDAGPGRVLAKLAPRTVANAAAASAASLLEPADVAA
ncbi:Polyketide biosynthesis malonyl CoA-acyl carrier protein transacylase BaeC [Baekduia alba]|uniref:ACP S-malonyltransferase n=1 Tax=Baekduia alba TaxID=2997333 RepID=UPI00233FA9AC|nr:ACP S-malonyltransferase [Baekduia alba]WCB96308.1 Polyketide biosynthesis malonyl CoA-acyl carrier protein transacylase BaeC [Baekduia alba]